MGLCVAGASGLLGTTFRVPLGVFANVGHAAQELRERGAHGFSLVVESTPRVPDFEGNRVMTETPDSVHRRSCVGPDGFPMQGH